jgi:predicted lipoprotein with Yx(FWY)xxD motif
MRTSGPARLAVTVAAVLALAGCGDNGSSDDKASDGGGNGASSIEVSSTSLGEVLTDADGMTLYMFTEDGGGSSACEGSCLSTWPILAGKPDAGSGADASLIGTIERGDGDTQATYGGHPLYYYAGDSSAGDVNGQEVQDTWYVLDAQGQPVETKADSGGQGGGY